MRPSSAQVPAWSDSTRSPQGTSVRSSIAPRPPWNDNTQSLQRARVRPSSAYVSGGRGRNLVHEEPRNEETMNVKLLSSSSLDLDRDVNSRSRTPRAFSDRDSFKPSLKSTFAQVTDYKKSKVSPYAVPLTAPNQFRPRSAGSRGPFRQTHFNVLNHPVIFHVLHSTAVREYHRKKHDQQSFARQSTSFSNEGEYKTIDAELEMKEACDEDMLFNIHDDNIVSAEPALAPPSKKLQQLM